MRRIAALRVAAVLWIVWGLVHVLAGVLTVAQDATGAVQGIADAVDPALLEQDYPAAVGAILNQHGWNLGWIGLTTLVCAPLIWRGNSSAIFLAAWVGGLADVGYFVFIDLGGFARLVPGTLMTVVSASAIVLSFWAHFGMDRSADPSSACDEGSA